MSYLAATIRAAFASLVLALIPTWAYPHSGGLDAYGCHNDRKHGGYHCHSGELAGQSFVSKQDMLRALQPSAPPSPRREEAATVLTPRPSVAGKDRACIREDRTKQVMCGELVK